jgi:hypothetical protein
LPSIGCTQRLIKFDDAGRCNQSTPSHEVVVDTDLVNVSSMLSLPSFRHGGVYAVRSTSPHRQRLVCRSSSALSVSVTGVKVLRW